MLIDSHCHLQFKAFEEDKDDVIQRCLEKNVMVNVVGTQKDTSSHAVSLAEKYEYVYATVGLHPVHLFPMHVDESEGSFLSREEVFDEEYYSKLINSSKKVIAIGECGIDLFHLPEDRSLEEVLSKQKQIFQQQYDFAQNHNLPLVIHVRDAHEQMLEILESYKTQIRGVAHCFTSNWKFAKRYLDLGLHLGFTGVITFPAKKTNTQATEDLMETVFNCPIESLLLETDSPYLAPQKYRGERCEPWMVVEVAKKVGEIKRIDQNEVEKVSQMNFQKLFLEK